MKATISSISFLASWRTRLVHFLVLPIINVFLITAINKSFFNAASWNVAAASVLMSGALLCISCLAASFTTDLNLGIDREVAAKGGFSFYYWGCKAAVALLSALVMILINLLLLFLIGGNNVPVLAALLVTPQLLFSSLAVGFVAILGSWGAKDPYRFSNFIISFGNVLSGSLVVVSAYPPALKIIAKIFPFANTLAPLHGVAGNLRHDLILSVIWLLAAAILYMLQIGKIRRQAKFSTL